MPLDLLVPDLLLPQDAPAAMRALRLPELEKWLARADVETVAGTGAMRWLGAAFDLADLPVAAIERAGEGASDGAWMRADPIHLRIDHDDLKLHDASILDVRREEADAMVAALQEHFRQDGLEFHAAAAERWYVRVPEDALPRKTTPVDDALGRNVFGLLPENAGTPPRINWRSALTEAQMVLSGHEVNARRESEGKLAINSVWFWGEGPRPAALAKRYALVHADDAFARGLGIMSGAEVRPAAKSIAEIDLVRKDEAVLAVIGDLTAALRRIDSARWQETARALDTQWFAGLGESIERFERVRLILPAGTDTRIANLTAGSRWRWFRGRKPLAAHA